MYNKCCGFDWWMFGLYSLSMKKSSDNKMNKKTIKTNISVGEISLTQVLCMFVIS